jgi:hypothetical protein
LWLQNFRQSYHTVEEGEEGVEEEEVVGDILGIKGEVIVP